MKLILTLILSLSCLPVFAANIDCPCKVVKVTDGDTVLWHNYLTQGLEVLSYLVAKVIVGLSLA